MSATLLSRLRRFWLNVHLWIGAGLFIVLAPLGVSGSVLVYRDATDHALHPERYAVTAGPAALAPSAYFDAAARAFGPGVRPAQLRLPGKAGEPVVVSGRGRPAKPGARPAMLNAWIDPPTGRVLATASPMAGFTRLMHDLHGQMLVPKVGRKVVGWLGVAMLVNCLTGLWLWWPSGGRILKGLRWRRSPSTIMNLHHLVGFWILVPLAVLSATGAYISFPETVRALSGAARPVQGGGPRGAAPLDHPQMTPEAALTRALDGKADARLSSLALPSKGDRPSWRIELRGGGRPQAVMVDDATGEVRPAPPQGGDPMARLMRQVHEGSAPGEPWRVIVFIAGLAPTVLGVTGIVMWLRRRARRRVLHALQPGAA
jgi:uncharacterized iron-regulated membrane protein